MTVKRLYKLGFIDAPTYLAIERIPLYTIPTQILNERGKALQAALLRNEGIKAEIARREALGAANAQTSN
jgi:hypothetical protein